MKNKFSTLSQSLIALTFFFFSLATCFAEPPNLSLLKKDVFSYYDNGLYGKELNDVLAEARNFIMSQVKLNNQRPIKKNLAIVLDIDETSLSNYQKIYERDFNNNGEQIHQEILKADSPALKPMLSLYNEVIKHGVNVFFVTGRRVDELSATIHNLKRAGFNHWTGLYVRPNNYNQHSITPFKSKTRALIKQKGFTIIANIGDQYSDLLGGNALKSFKLPNPFYYIP